MDLSYVKKSRLNLTLSDWFELENQQKMFACFNVYFNWNCQSVRTLVLLHLQHKLWLDLIKLIEGTRKETFLQKTKQEIYFYGKICFKDSSTFFFVDLLHKKMWRWNSRNSFVIDSIEERSFVSNIFSQMKSIFFSVTRPLKSIFPVFFLLWFIHWEINWSALKILYTMFLIDQ